MGFSYIIAGLVFLFNPSINVIDFLPDFIGYAFLLAGLSKLRDLSHDLKVARDLFAKLLALSVIRFVLMFTVPFIPEKERILLLVYAFVFAVFDFILLYPAFCRLFDGTVYLGMRRDTESVYRGMSDCRALTTVFVFARALMCVLPEISYLLNDDASGTVSSLQANTSGYYNILTLLNLAVITVFGAIWLASIIPYFARIKKDKAFVAALSDVYGSEIASDEKLTLRRGIRKPLYLILVGLIFVVSISFSGVNIIPDFLCAVIIIFAAIKLKKYSKNASKLLAASIVAAAVSAAYWALSVRFAEVNFYENLVKYEQPRQQFYLVAAAAVLSSVAMIAVFVLIRACISDIIKSHTGSEVTMPSDIQRNERLFRSLGKRNTRLMVMGILCSVSHALMCGTVCCTKNIWYISISSYSFVDILLCLLMLFDAYRLVTSLTESIDYKYM